MVLQPNVRKEGFFMYINPYEKVGKDEQAKWMRGNFHTHAGTGEGTCGKYPIEMVLDNYRERGYEVMTISNHDFFSDTSALAEKYNMTLINGFEYSPKHHMLCINTQNAFTGDHQSVIDETTRQGGIIVFCHPRWEDGLYWTDDQIAGFRIGVV